MVFGLAFGMLMGMRTEGGGVLGIKHPLLRLLHLPVNMLWVLMKLLGIAIDLDNGFYDIVYCMWVQWAVLGLCVGVYWTNRLRRKLGEEGRNSGRKRQ
jgi:hypothetical protein